MKTKILLMFVLLSSLTACERDGESGNLIVAIDNTANTSGVYTILIDGKSNGSIVREPNFKASNYVNCGDDWVKISKTTNVSVVTGVSGGKHKVELQRQGNKVIVTSWDIDFDKCKKLVAVF
ncbi:hypothetical protein [Chryseobacterium sp. RR2-3-20]|uniref:hypothetical protein n=1 Tax=Chryseobacterium sp. RR2-3-20 TaxID=2787626 RepID=UPI001ADF4DB5|nr:hypothetical protein [Chryseobacterium sp. RR2-3-20]